MKIQKISLSNIRSFENVALEFVSGINVIVGFNNSGKSTLLKAILDIQIPSIHQSDIRDKNLVALSEIDFDEPVTIMTDGRSINGKFYKYKAEIGLTRHSRELIQKGTIHAFQHSNILEPYNYIYPFLSKRKPNSFSETINLGTARSVLQDLSNLAAKIDTLADSGHPKHPLYRKYCEDVLGFYVHTQPSPSGKRAGILINDFDFISVDNMGDGVSNILGLIVNLCLADNKIFVIEELENDIHPRALKALLKLIKECSRANQFIISTHSNIVVGYLGGEENFKLFYVKSKFLNKLFTSSVQVIESKQDRRLVLEELGYQFLDLELWAAWIIFEESSAEYIIGKYLIPWFTPALKNQVRTFACRGFDAINDRFESLNNIFVYLHLEPIYKNKV